MLDVIIKGIPSEYKKNYDKRLKKFIEEYEVNEKYFIEDEITIIQDILDAYSGEENVYSRQISKIIEVDPKLNSGFKLKLQLHEKLDFLIQKKESLSENKTNIEFPIKLKLTSTEIVELAKALVENGNLKKGTQIELINFIGLLANKKVNHPDQTIQDIKSRKVGDETIFLKKLSDSLKEFMEKS